MKDEKIGKVYWITGLSGAGKTTIGYELYQQLSQSKQHIVFLDGDMLREVFGNDLGYTAAERFQCAMRYARLCRLLAGQGLEVILCTISMFDEVRTWNRKNIAGYKEIYIKVSEEELIRRNQKNLYSGIKHGSARNVAGMDLQVELPKSPDLIIENNGTENPAVIAARILQEVG